MPDPFSLLGRPSPFGTLDRADVMVGVVPDAEESEGALVVERHLDVLVAGFREEETLGVALSERLRLLRPAAPPPEPDLHDLVHQGRARLREERQRVDNRWLDRRLRAALDLRSRLVR